eukprot:CAMPEP_0170491474 /NCGR_PEP_ID=MMETSP0208-20121228/11060_1 /TAXON_ID=197538 /ORGANISM="Strombidium inclinatum, Strain S3" /LENGTH=53 /DNA_ID=CAMNT_0010767053 /DNA_START=8 /DNA_END=169 /DNA_ORIENTATION=+
MGNIFTPDGKQFHLFPVNTKTVTHNVDHSITMNKVNGDNTVVIDGSHPMGGTS